MLTLSFLVILTFFGRFEQLFGLSDFKDLRHLYSLKFTQTELQKKVAKGQPPSWAVAQIAEDLKPFQEIGISCKALEDKMILEKEGASDRGLVYFRISENTVSVICASPSCHTNPALLIRLNSIQEALRFLCAATSIPDIDFLVSLHDGISDVQSNAPIFSFAKHKEAQGAINMPDFEILSNGYEHLKSVAKGMEQYPWKKKQDVAFWRGAVTGGLPTMSNFLDLPRTRAVTASLKHPNLVDARFHLLPEGEESEKIKERFKDYFAASVSIKKHLKYKYQILIDGNSCAYSRAFWQLFSNSVILKQTSPHIQWYYGALKPYVHYIPLQEDLTDLVSQLKWAKNNERKVLKIVKNAQTFAHDNLKQSDVFYYLYLLFHEYAKLLHE
jgi:hypothetical protein